MLLLPHIAAKCSWRFQVPILLKLIKSTKNPIIAPRLDKGWEIDGTFNPGAISWNDSIHLLYRAADHNGVSRLGYAQTVNGVDVSFRTANPVMEPSAWWEEFGCEDPRITNLDGRFYVTYTAYSRAGPRIALASTEDFTKFEKYGLVGPDRDDKDFVLFPERIRGRIAILHRLESYVQIAYFDDISSLMESQEFWNGYLKRFEEHEVLRSSYPWEERKMGVGPPPIKTSRGWLVLYHGVSMQKVYRAGAVLLDLDDPQKVLARTSEPILEPEMEFEKNGVVSNVVFPEGAIIRNNQLIVYYGAGDKVCCVASIPAEEFLDDLEKNSA